MEYRYTLQLKISYAHHLINTLPQGRVGTYRQRQVVVITHDPGNPCISYNRKRRLYTNGKEGAKYLKLINLHQKALLEYKRLMNEWKTYYAGEPKIIQFPLDPTLLSGLSPEFFKQARPNQNSYERKEKIQENNQVLRSKNELLAVKEIEKMGFEWKTEIKVSINGKNFYPDVTFLVPYIQCALMMEIDGIMEDKEYRYKAIDREHKYYKAGFSLFDDVIIYRTKNSNSFDAELLRFEINMAIERIAERIVKGTPEIPPNQSPKNAFQVEKRGIFLFDDEEEDF